METIRISYLAVADVLTVAIPERGESAPLPSVGPVQVRLGHDGRFAGMRVNDFSASWPMVNKDQLGRVTSAGLIRLLDERHAALVPAPPTFGLAGAQLAEALEAGFSLDLEVA